MTFTSKEKFSVCGYVNSINSSQNGTVFMERINNKDFLIADIGIGFIGEVYELEGCKKIKAELTHENACILRNEFPFTAPVPVLHRACTVGVGDRLGIATSGHIRVFQKYCDVTPVFAQQSLRELKQTNRTFEDVLDSVTFAVFKNGYKSGFGADGDHLKTAEEVEYALSCGYSMITLDISDHLKQDSFSITDDQVDSMYTPDTEMEAIYINHSFAVDKSMTIYFDEAEFKRCSLIFSQAINFVNDIYHKYFSKGEYKADLEISIDETITATTLSQHFFIANELKRRGVEFSSIAPRFCGEFQKGIDYIGDISQFEVNFRDHNTIAEYFNYKISIHSGSDKFSVFPIIGRVTEGKFHLKTSGTSWLEAMRVVAIKDPILYREVHKYALTVFDEVKTLYHVTTDLRKIPDIDTLTDNMLPDLFLQNDFRQLIHITYGAILNRKDLQGNFVFKDRLYKLWNEQENFYHGMLEQHFTKHLEFLLGEVQTG